MLFEEYGISRELCEMDAKVMDKCAEAFRRCEEIRDYNHLKMLKAFTENRVSLYHLGLSTGYGHEDVGKDVLDAVFRDSVGAEDALCRSSFMSGTHTLTVALFGVLRPGNTLLAATGRPYDTLRSVIGLEKGCSGTLMDFGIKYDECPLINGEPDYDMIRKKAVNATVVHVQRSRGYENRRAYSVEDIEKIAATVKEVNPSAIVFVDNCYGEYCDTTEPVQHGADLMVGSLIKNGGGGIAPTGGYIAGRKDLVEMCAERLTAPGIGKDLGSTPGGLRDFFLGLYFAPHTTCEAKKSSIYASCLFEEFGLKATPGYNDPRNDIITSVEMGKPEGLIAVCEAIQASSPIDSYATPVPDEMPGYADKIVMASGAFTQGSSIELSADGPLRAPYVAYIQGGLNLVSSRLAYLRTIEKIRNL